MTENVTHQLSFPFLCPGLKDRMNLCLFCLSLVDGMFVIFYSLAGSHCLAHFFRPDLETWWKWSVHSRALGLLRGSLLCSGCLTMIISVERCVCVFLPLRATSLIRTRTMAVILFTTIAAIQAVCMIYPLKVQTPVLALTIHVHFVAVENLYFLITVKDNNIISNQSTHTTNINEPQ